MTAPTTRHKLLRFGAFELDVTRGALLRDGQEIRLRRQTFGVLQYLAENAGRLVSKDEIFEAVWGKTVVTDDSLTQCLVEIRRALGDGSHEAIRTVPRRGYVFDLPVETVESSGSDGGVPFPTGPVPPARRRHFRIAALALAATAVFALGGIWWATERTPASVVPSPAAAPSIAVLPFADLSEEQDQQYFAEGLAEEILNLLAQLPELRVIARTSSFAFRDRNADARAIGTTLGVTYLLEGSVRRSADRVRVTAQLIDASDGSHLWSRAYDREMGDLLELQETIARAIARTLEIRLTDAAPGAAVRAVNPTAHDLYLHGRFLWSRRSAGDLARAQDHLQRAVEIDPGHGPAWALLSGVAFVRIWEDGLDPQAALAIMAGAIERALVLVPNGGEVHARAAQYYFQTGDFERSRRHWERALALEPDNPLVLGFSAGVAGERGDTAIAVEFQRRAVQRDPVGFVNRFNLSGFLEMDGRYEESWRELLRARELNPDASGIDTREAGLLVMRGRNAEALGAAERLPASADREMMLALAYGGLGRQAEAEAAIQQLRARPDTERASRLAKVHAWRDERDEAFEWLARAQQVAKATALTFGESQRPTHVIDSGFLNSLRVDPRFEAYLLRRYMPAPTQKP